MSNTLSRIIENEVLALANHTAEVLQKANDSWFEDCANLFPESDDDDPPEVMQWWIIDDQWGLDCQLETMGEVIWRTDDLTFWGRTGCGYALTDERCLQDVAKGRDA